MTKATDHFMPFYFSDYLRDTQHLTTDGHGAYLLLIAACWIAGGRLTDDDSHWQSIARLSPQRWKVLKPTLQAFFQQQADGTWMHKRVSIELARANLLISARQEAGRRGGLVTQERARATDGQAIAKASARPNCEQMLEQSSEQTAKPSSTPLHLTLTQEEDSKNPSLGVGRALRARSASRTDFTRVENRQAFAARKIAEAIGWDKMLAADDQHHPNHRAACDAAKAEARRQRLTWHAPGEPGHEAARQAVAATAFSRGNQ